MPPCRHSAPTDQPGADVRSRKHCSRRRAGRVVVVPLDAHIRRANPRTAKTDGSRILRRGYAYRSDPDGPGRADEGFVHVVARHADVAVQTGRGSA
nr:Dyp-type peroxidase domain-containing protein [Actinocatenispora sera]